MKQETALVSVILPCYNESAYIAGVVDSFLNQDYAGEIEILIADGMSDDGTREILKGYAEKYANVTMLDNVDKVTPAALKLLLATANGEYIVRGDCHAYFPANYVSSLVGYLAEGAAENVGGVIQSNAGDDSTAAQVIARCLNSKFGVGVSFRSLSGDKPVEVETVPFGAWRAKLFEEFGSFDDDFVRAQDLEFNIRLRKAGHKILCLPWVQITYFSRGTFAKLRKMAYQYGYWKLPVQQKHGGSFSLRQYFPPVLVTGSVVSLIAGTVWWPLWMPVLMYGMLCFFCSLIESMRFGSFKTLPLFVWGFMILHYGYGLGYLRGFIDVRLRKSFGCNEVYR